MNKEIVLCSICGTKEPELSIFTSELFLGRKMNQLADPILAGEKYNLEQNIWPFLWQFSNCSLNLSMIIMNTR